MRPWAMAAFAAVLALLPVPVAAAETCTAVKEIWTDGRGNGRTKSLGGTYVPVPIGDIAPGTRLVVRGLSGEVRYVVLHARTTRGIWHVAYAGAETAFAHDASPVARCRDDKSCTHVVVQINGQHESYEPIVGRAMVEICRPVSTPHAGEAPAGAWVALPNNGMRIRVPEGWSREIDDTAELGNALFLSPDGAVAVGLAAMAEAPGGHDETIALFEQSAFTGASRVREEAMEVNGVLGVMRAYLMGEGDGQLVAIAFYVSRGGRFHTAWSLMPRGLYEARSAETAAMIDSFTLLDAAPPPGVAPPGVASAGPPAVVHFAVGEAADPATGVVARPESLFDSTVEEIVAVFRLAGPPGTGVSLRLLHGASGTVVSDGPVTLAPGRPAGTALGLVRFPRPDDPWPLGLYELQIRQGDVLLSRRMFFVRP